MVRFLMFHYKSVCSSVYQIRFKIKILPFNLLTNTTQKEYVSREYVFNTHLYCISPQNPAVFLAFFCLAFTFPFLCKHLTLLSFPSLLTCTLIKTDQRCQKSHLTLLKKAD